MNTTPRPTEPADLYSDEWLEWAKQHSPSRGERNSASYLQRIPFEHRQRARAIAWSIMNRHATNFSGAVADAVAELQRANYGETLTERQGREWREREQERRQAAWQAEVRASLRQSGVTA